MKYTIASLALLSASAAAADIFPQANPIDADLTRALEEQRMMQTCSATFGIQVTDLMTTYFADRAETVLEMLAPLHYTSPAVAEMRTVAETGILILPLDTTLAELIDYCNQDPSWLTRYGQLELFDVVNALRQAQLELQ